MNEHTTPIAYPFAVVKTRDGFSAAALDFPAMASADSAEELHELLSEQAALYLYEAELHGGDPPRPTTRRELDRRRDGESAGTQFVYVEPAETNYISLAIDRAMREEGVTVAQLAHRLGASVMVVQRLTDPFYFGHSTRTLRAVAAALGRQLRVSFDLCNGSR